MANPGGNRPPLPAVPPSANDLLRARWQRWVRGAIAVSVVAHLLLIVLGPRWVLSRLPPLDFTREALQLAWLPPAETSPEPAGSPEEEPAAEEPGAETPSGADGVEAAFADLVDMLRDRVPSASDPTIATLPLASPNQAREAANPLAVDYADVLRTAPIDLDRLAGLTANLSLTNLGPDWPLIRNPNTVLSYIQSRYQNPGAVGASGDVTVAMWIDDRGEVGWVEVQRSSGSDALDEIALTVFSQVAEFRAPRGPGRQEGLAMLVSIRFPF